MARITENTKNYAKGCLMESGAIPDGANFIVLEAADLARGNWNWSDPASCVNHELGGGGLLDTAYQMGMPVLLRFTVRIDWMNFKPDTINPQNDKQLNVFKAALSGKKPGASYVGIVVGWDGEESEGNQTETVRFYADQFEKLTGVPVFIEVNESQWKAMPHMQTTIGLETSHWPLCITDDH